MRPDRVARLVLTAGFLFVLAANLPGQMSYDSVRALYQGTHGLSPGFASPLMNALLGLFDKIIPGTALFVTLDALAFFASLIWISRVRTGASWWSVPAALLIVSSPLVVVTQGTVWHDVLFANLAIAGFTCLA